MLQFSMRMRTFLLGVGLLSAVANAASVSLEKEPVVLGRTESVALTIKIDELPGTEARPLRLSVNVGSFGPIERVGPGTYRTVYLPPTTRFPQVALMAVWRETGPDAAIDFLRVPLYGMTQIPVSARPGSEVKVEIGTQEFGPVTVGASGRTVVPVVIPPGVPEAIINVKEKSNNVTKKHAKVDVPPYNRITMAVVPHALLANGKDPARIEVFYDLGGANLPADRLKLEASLGQAKFQHADRGRYVYRYVPPSGTTEKEARFEVSVTGDPVTRGSIPLELGLPPPQSVVVNTPDSALPSDGQSHAKVSVLVFDATGLGLPQQSVELTANGRPLTDLVYVGNGLYEATFVAPAVYPAGGLIQFQAKVARAGGALTGTANYQVLPQAVPTALNSELSPNPAIADGKSKARVTLDVRDAAGLPLLGAQLFLLPDTGVMSPLVETGEGRYQSEYTAPSDAATGEATVRVVDASGTFERKLQIPLRAGPSLLLGIRGGYTHSLGQLSGPRGGLDAWVPFHLGGSTLGVGLSATYGQAQQTVEDGVFSTRSSASIVPVIARLGYEFFASRRLSVHGGLGAQLTWVEVRSSALRTPAHAVRIGGLGFVSVGLTLGPGQLFAELAYAIAPVEHPDFRLNAGGATLEAGYRLGLF
jgi:hypothetical protein